MTRLAPPRALRPDDDLAHFDCGRESLNLWLRRRALPNHVSGVSRVNVLVEPATQRVAAFVSLSAGQIAREFLPKAEQRNRPDPIPVTLLGQLAVDRKWQGQGYAASLLRFALRTSLLASREIGSLGVLTHPLDDSLRAFYTRWGFCDPPFDPRRAMFVRMADLAKSTAE